MRPIIRRAFAQDIKDWFQKPVPTMRAIVIELEGELIGIAGYVFDGKRMIAFSEMKETLRHYKKTILLAGKAFMQMVKEYGVPVIAIASECEKNAPCFLLHLGFWHQETHQGQEVFVWRG